MITVILLPWMLKPDHTLCGNLCPIQQKPLITPGGKAASMQIHSPFCHCLTFQLAEQLNRCINRPKGR